MLFTTSISNINVLYVMQQYFVVQIQNCIVLCTKHAIILLCCLDPQIFHCVYMKFAALLMVTVSMNSCSDNIPLLKLLHYIGYWYFLCICKISFCMYKICYNCAVHTENRLYGYIFVEHTQIMFIM